MNGQWSCDEWMDGWWLACRVYSASAFSTDVGYNVLNVCVGSLRLVWLGMYWYSTSTYRCFTNFKIDFHFNKMDFLLILYPLIAFPRKFPRTLRFHWARTPSTSTYTWLLHSPLEDQLRFAHCLLIVKTCSACTTPLHSHAQNFKMLSVYIKGKYIARLSLQKYIYSVVRASLLLPQPQWIVGMGLLSQNGPLNLFGGLQGRKSSTGRKLPFPIRSSTYIYMVVWSLNRESLIAESGFIDRRIRT